jgi:hypothetical protein
VGGNIILKCVLVKYGCVDWLQVVQSSVPSQVVLKAIMKRRYRKSRSGRTDVHDLPILRSGFIQTTHSNEVLSFVCVCTSRTPCFCRFFILNVPPPPFLQRSIDQ